MTVTPLHGRPRRPRQPSPPGTSGAAVAVSGEFPAPSGGTGAFRGSYRFERLVSEHGQAAVAGVFAGVLLDPDGNPIGTGSRRHTAAAVIAFSRLNLVAQVGPVEVNVLGLPVLVAPFEVALRRGLPAGAEGGPGRTTDPSRRG